jgi:alpha-1,4-digalacturonate transport system permease protein
VNTDVRRWRWGGSSTSVPAKLNLKEEFMRLSYRWQRRLTPYLFVAPNLSIFLLFIIIPAFYSFYLSLFRTYFDRPPEFVGLANFSYLFQRDDIFARAVRNMVFFVIGDVTLVVVLALLIALLLNEKIRFRAFWRSVFFYPVLLSPVIVALIWRNVLNTQYGLLNGVLRTLNLSPQPWLLNGSYAQFWVIVVHVWAGVGFYALIVLAGLQSVPPSLYDAAVVDGANRRQSFWYVTLPSIMPVLFVVLILNVIRAMEVFEQIYVLTGGGPGFSTLMIVQYIYRAGFELNQFGLASAAALVLFTGIFMLTAIQYVIGRFREAI